MKVHFAGLEIGEFAAVLEHVAGVSYGLFSVFSYISGKAGIKSSFGNAKSDYVYKHARMKHMIMDSGLFTLMFGAHKGKRDKKFVDQWQEWIVEFVRDTGYTGCVVEVDCQKILGVKQAWTLREKLKKQLKNELMHVWHLEDGRQGLRDMAKFAKYMAVSVPEWRFILKGRKVRIEEQIYAIASEIKEANPKVRIHLLGCTQETIMRKCQFCETSDSTSWQKATRFGAEKIAGQLMEHRSLVRNSRHLVPEIKTVLSRFEMKIPSQRMLEYLSVMSMAAASVRRKYEETAGSQL